MKTEATKQEHKELFGDNRKHSNIIIVGQAKGTYSNDKITKEFEAKVLVSARPDGTVIVHNLSDGVRPICYINGGAEVSLARNTTDAEIGFIATTEDGQEVTLQFTDVVTLQGVPTESQTDSMAISVLQCVFDMGGKYGRTTIARVLIGSVSKKILSIKASKLGTYAVAKDASMKEVLTMIDWLVEESYLAYVEDSEFPILVVTSKGLGIMSGIEDTPEKSEPDMSAEEIERRKASLKEWRDRKSTRLNSSHIPLSRMPSSA